MIGRRQAIAGMLAAALAWAAGPAVAEDLTDWFEAGINVGDYVFRKGRDAPENEHRMRDFRRETRPIPRYEDTVRFPPPEGLEAVSIRAKPTARPGGMGTLSRTVPAARWRGKRVRLSANLRTQNAGRAQMWMRIDGPNRQVLALDDMQSRPIRGTSRWRRYSIVLNVPASATHINYGFLLAGSGTVWANDFSINETRVPTTGKP